MIELFYKKKIIRDFLSLFSQKSWQSLIVSMVEYAIINLKSNSINYNTYSAEELISLVEKLKVDMNLVEKKYIKNTRSNSKQRQEHNSSFMSNSSKTSKNKSSLSSAYNNSKRQISNNKSNTGDFSKNSNNRVENNLSNLTKPTLSKLNKTKPDLKEQNSLKSNIQLVNKKIKSNSKTSSKSKFQALEIKQIEKIKMKKAQEKNDQIENLTREEEKTKNFKQKISNNIVQSKIRNQVENDKKIYTKMQSYTDNQESPMRNINTIINIAPNNNITNNSNNKNISSSVLSKIRNFNNNYYSNDNESECISNISNISNNNADVPIRNPLLNKILNSTNKPNIEVDNLEFSIGKKEASYEEGKKSLQIMINDFTNKNNSPSQVNYDYKISKNIEDDSMNLESKISGLRKKINELSNYNQTSLSTNDNNKNIVYNSIKPSSDSKIRSLNSSKDKNIEEPKEQDNDDDVSDDNFNKYNYVYMDDE